MEIIYEGRNITGSVNAIKVDVIDSAGGIADSLEMEFSNTEGRWDRWSPQKGDVVAVREKGFSSGTMYMDSIEQVKGIFRLKAVSTPLPAKTTGTKTWENIRFFAIVNEIAGRYGFRSETYGAENWLYRRVDQLEQADFDFLAFRCMLEGYVLKVNGGKVIIYSEPEFEKEEPVVSVHVQDMDGNYSFKSKGIGLYSRCILEYSGSRVIRSEFSPANPPDGPVLKKRDIPVYSQAEADRYCRNILRYHNKQEYSGKFAIELTPGLAAGNMIRISGAGFGDGIYFTEYVVHRIVEKKTILKLRKPLEGY